MSDDELLVSDAERESALAGLREAYVEGRLNLEEYSQRMDATLAARTRGQLAELTRDLPAIASPAAPGSTYAAPSGPLQPAPNWTVSIMSDTKRQGRWRLREPLNALSLMASLRLDLRQADIPHEAVLNVFVIMGDVKILVPEGVEVDFGEITLMGSQQDKRTSPPPPPGAPVVRLRGFVLMGNVEVINEERNFMGKIAERLGGRVFPPVQPGELGPPSRTLGRHDERLERRIERKLDKLERRIERHDRRRE
ncbi:MAG TPA: DUF1707 domain-containing protein [Thermomicrobiaceae bacterium]|nr:DUF1707 domain-containing protein [Thermomicrobiaceae bacterium]